MVRSSQQGSWISRMKWLTQALIISGTLNIGLLSTFIYFVFKDKQKTLNLHLGNLPTHKAPVTHLSLLGSYSVLPYQELIVRLENADPVEEGLCKRDLALSCLVAFHHFNLDQAIGSALLQKRILQLTHTAGQETIDIPVFPGLTDSQFRAILHYAKTEKWPFTPEGLFYEITRCLPSPDPSLIEAFALSSEYHAVDILFAKTGLDLSRDQIIALIAEGRWSFLSQLCREQRSALDLSIEKRRSFLLQYLDHRSAVAAHLLLDHDPEFVCKRLGDSQILILLDLCEEKASALERIAKELLTAPRTDVVRSKAASLLYILAGESLPEPFDHSTAVHRFFPQREPLQVSAAVEAIPPVEPPKIMHKVHVVEPGDNLWKIARKYRVSIEEIKRLNEMDTERLRPGKQLKIPERKS